MSAPLAQTCGWAKAGARKAQSRGPLTLGRDEPSLRCAKVTMLTFRESPEPLSCPRGLGRFGHRSKGSRPRMCANETVAQSGPSHPCSRALNFGSHPQTARWPPLMYPLGSPLRRSYPRSCKASSAHLGSLHPGRLSQPDPPTRSPGHQAPPSMPPLLCGAFLLPTVRLGHEHLGVLRQLF